MPLSSERTGVPRFAGMQANSRTSPPPSLAGERSEIVEMHVAVCLRPQADTTGHWFRQRVLQIELAVEIAFDLVARDTDLKIVPLTASRRRVSNPLHLRTSAPFEFPQHDIVFEAISPNGQIVTVRL